MNKLDLFFDHLEDFEHKRIFDDIQYVWDPLKNLGETITDILSVLELNNRPARSLKGVTASTAKLSRWPEPCLIVDRWMETCEPVHIMDLGIYLGAHTILEPTAIIKGPVVIGGHCEVRQGAYIRGNVLVGDHCVIGHNTEIKNSIVMNHSEAGHFNYIGDCILGSYVNLGAGTKLANLQFRSIEDKRKVAFPPITTRLEGREIETGLNKFGAVLGDFVEMGCNSVSSPGVLVGKNSWVYPNITLPKGFYPPNHFIGPNDKKLRLVKREISS